MCYYYWNAGGAYGTVGYSNSIYGGGYGLGGYTYTGHLLDPYQASSYSYLPTYASAAPTSPSETDVLLGAALSRSFGMASSEFAAGLAEGMLAGAEGGAWAGPAGAIIGGIIGGAIAYYIFTR